MLNTFIDVGYNNDYGSGGILEFNKMSDVGGVIGTSGYVLTEIAEDHFLVTVVDGDGEVLSETVVPFNFKDVESDI